MAVATHLNAHALPILLACAMFQEVLAPTHCCCFCALTAACKQEM